MKELSQKERDFLAQSIRAIPNFPKEGIIFRDITTLFNNTKALSFLLKHLGDGYKDMNLDFIVGTENRGFIFASMICARLNLPFAPIRKPGKLPYKTFSCSYDLEYGSDTIEIYQGAFRGVKKAKALLINDLIATGGMALAFYELIQKAGGICVESCFLINLRNLNGWKKFNALCSVYSVLEF